MEKGRRKGLQHRHFLYCLLPPLDSHPPTERDLMMKVQLPSIRELAVGLPDAQQLLQQPPQHQQQQQHQHQHHLQQHQQHHPLQHQQVPRGMVYMPMPQQQQQQQMMPMPMPAPVPVVMGGPQMVPPQPSVQVLHQPFHTSMPKKKRPRRKANEMVRLYACNYNSCRNSYGTLNHLNAHITFKRHGPKRKPEEFKQIRELYKLQKTADKNKILDTLGDKIELPVFHQQRGYNGYGRHDHTLNKKELEKLA